MDREDLWAGCLVAIFTRLNSSCICWTGPWLSPRTAWSLWRWSNSLSAFLLILRVSPRFYVSLQTAIKKTDEVSAPATTGETLKGVPGILSKNIRLQEIFQYNCELLVMRGQRKNSGPGRTPTVISQSERRRGLLHQLCFKMLKVSKVHEQIM